MSAGRPAGTRRVAAGIAAMTLVASPLAAWAYQFITSDGAGGTLGLRWMYAGTPIGYRQNGANDPAGIDGPAKVDEAFATWQAVPSAAIAFSRGADTTLDGFDFDDGVNTISYGDPDSDLGSGILAAAIPYAFTGSDDYHSFDGTNYYTIVQGDIVFNDGVDYTDTAGAAQVTCLSKWDIEAVALHEIGHFFGLQHPDGMTYAQAIMYPSIADCDETRAALKTDDINGATALYDSGVPPVYPDFELTPAVGYAPLEVDFEDTTAGTVTSRSWDFGNGDTGSGATETTTYDQPGLYDVTLTVNGSVVFERIDAVEVIEAPTPDFTANVTRGRAPLTVQFENDTANAGDDPAYKWTFGDGESSTKREPEHTYFVEGTYSVKLKVDAGAGYVSVEKEGFIVVEGEDGDGKDPWYACDVALGGGASRSAVLSALSALALAGILTARRRST